MNSKLLKALTVLCVLALLACGLTILFRNFHIGLHYANAEQYTAGAAEIDGKVKNLDIHWTAGQVNIAYHDKDTVEIAETAKKAISGDAQLRWWLDGDTLRVQYAKSGYYALFSQDKALTLTLPEGTALDGVDVDVTSGDVTVPDLMADKVKVHLTSGDLQLKQSGKAESVQVSSTSGDLSVDVGEVNALDVSVTSGKIAVNGDDVRETRINSTSGRIDVALSAFEALRIDATSGDIAVALPAEPGYRADLDTTSGRIDYAVPLTRDGDDYVSGDGGASVRIDTTSGNISLTDVNE